MKRKAEEAELAARIQELRGIWYHDQATHRLARHFEFDDFEAALAWHEELARHVWKHGGQEEWPKGHEPLLTLQGLEVRIYITGSSEGLREADLNLAESIEELAHAGDAVIA